MNKLLVLLNLILLLSIFSCSKDDESPSVENPVEIDFIASPVQGVAPLNVVFNNQSRGDITSWYWDFDDSGSSTLENPSYTFNSSGEHTVTLTGVDSNGTSLSKTKTSYIIVTGAQAPFSNFEVDQNTGLAWQTKFQFNNRSTGIIDSYSWDFGDGMSSNLENPSHTYTSPGKFTVMLTVSGPGGESSYSYLLIVDDIVYVYVEQLGPLWPVKVSGGDCNFGGNGPDVIVQAQVFDPNPWEIVEDVEIHIFMEASETQSNWTRARSSWRLVLRELPDGIFVKDVLTGNTAEFLYEDTDLAYDYSPTFDLCRFAVMGDTNGDDICGTSLDDTHVILQNVSCEVRVGPR